MGASKMFNGWMGNKTNPNANNRKVTLHLYNVTTEKAVKKINNVIVQIPGVGKSGAFHAAVEIYGQEWSYGGTDVEMSGIFSGEPTKCDMHEYREAVEMGE